jgi:4-amino-4-deoxy-L-arabinose transferase-like glycosyltransferase
VDAEYFGERPASKISLVACDRMTAASRRFFARLALIVASAAAWRIWYVLGSVTDRIQRLAGDEFFYNWQARYFAEGRWFTNPFLLHNQHMSEPTALHPPLYTVFLAIPSALGFETPTEHRLATALLGIGTVALIGLLARGIAGDRAGLVAALLAALYPPLWSNDAVIGLETLYCFLVLLALLAVYRFWRTPSMWGAVAIAVPLALASLTRSEGIILFVLLGAPTALLSRSWDWKRRLEALGAMALVGMLIIGPWVVRNLTTFEERTVLGTGFGLVLAYGNCDATYSGRMLGYWDNGCLREYTPGVEESVFDKQAFDQGSSYIEAHAGRLPVVMLARLGRIWEVYRPVQNVELDEFFEQRGHAASWAVLIGYYVMLPLAIFGLVAMRRRRVPIYPMIAIVIAVSVTVVLGFPVTRYRASFDAVTPVLVAVALDALWRRWRRTRPGDGTTTEPLDTAPVNRPVEVAP